MGIFDRLVGRKKQTDAKIGKRCFYHNRSPAIARCTKCNQPICRQCCNEKHSDFEDEDVVCVACKALETLGVSIDELKLQPHLCHSLAGTSLREANRLDEAIFHYEIAIKLARQCNAPSAEVGRLTHHLAITYGSKDEWRKSLNLHKKALDLAPNYDEGRQGLAIAYLALGNKKEARRQVEELKKRGYPIIPEILRVLNKL